jgi:hypothetical protein
MSMTGERVGGLFPHRFDDASFRSHPALAMRKLSVKQNFWRLVAVGLRISPRLARSHAAL